MKLTTGRTLYYGKGDVLTYRTYASPLHVQPIPESAYDGDRNVIFAHNVTLAVSGESLLPSFAEGDNGAVVATDSMKNFILRETAGYEGSTTEGLLAYLGEKLLDRYSHLTGAVIEAVRLPFDPLPVSAGNGGLLPSELVYRKSRNERASSRLEFLRNPETKRAVCVSQRSGVSDLQLIKVSGSSFYGFIRDEYTTLPESFDRPLFIYLDIHWRYRDPLDAFDAGRSNYVAAEQAEDIAHHVFHERVSPSIQSLIYQIGLRLLKRFPQLEEVSFESNNRTWETVVEPAATGSSGVYTEPRPPYGFQGFSMTRADLEAAEQAGGGL